MHDVRGRVEALVPEVVSWRRHLHRNPELSFAEHATAAFVETRLRELPGIDVERPTPTSVVGRLAGRRAGRVIAIRADMDALPIQEETRLEYASSVPGVMHACGHDGHTAMLLGAATVLSELQVEAGEVRFIFQHAEEKPPGGARELVEAGVLEGVGAVLGAHLSTWIDVGRIALSPGPVMAASDVFSITVDGKGGHAARPHECVDPVAVGAEVVLALQQIVARQIDPLVGAVVSVTRFEG